jgi:hypothetical protein
MLVFPDGSAFNGTAASLTGFKSSAISGTPANVTLIAGPDATAAIDTTGAGPGTTIAFSDFTLGGAGSDNFALPISCCGPLPLLGRTTATITAGGSTGGTTTPGGGSLAPALLTIVPPAPAQISSGVNFAVLGTGVRMPPFLLAETTPEELVPLATVPEMLPVLAPAFVPPPEIIVPPEIPPAIFVPPQRRPRPDRN